MFRCTALYANSVLCSALFATSLEMPSPCSREHALQADEAKKAAQAGADKADDNPQDDLLVEQDIHHFSYYALEGGPSNPLYTPLST